MSATKKIRETFEVYRDTDGNYHREAVKDTVPVKLAVIRPNHKQQQHSQQVFTSRWKALFEAGTPLRAELNELLRKRELWNDEMEKKEKELIGKIDANLAKIKKGRIKLSEASLLMKDNIKSKAELIMLRYNRNQLDQNTAESLAEQERFNYLTSVCTVYEADNKPFFASYDDFLTQDELGSVVPIMAGEAMWRLQTDLDNDYRKEWPEYQFLQKYKVVDDKLRFIKDGHLVDIEGKKIDEDGNYLNEKGEKVDAQGGLLSEPQFGEILDEDNELIKV